MRRILVRTMFSCGLCCVGLVTACVAGPWYIETVDADGADNPSLALDSNGAPRIAYRDEVLPWGSALQYAQRNGGSWDIQAVEDVDDHRGWGASLALDEDDRPHIGYRGAADSLRYAAWNGASWDTQEVDTAGTARGVGSLALDSEGHPHVSYVSQTAFPGTVKCASWKEWGEAKWTLRSVDTVVSDELQGTPLAIDSADRPRICYIDCTTLDLKYAAWEGHRWDTEIVHTGDNPLCPRLALDAADRPRVAYLAWPSCALTYAAWSGHGWQIGQVGEARGRPYGPSLALDAEGTPHISYPGYVGDGSTKLCHASWDGSSWRSYIVDPNVLYPVSSSLAIDASGSIHIAYTYSGVLKYATNPGLNTPPTVPTSVAIDPSTPKSIDDLTACATGSTDVDGDSISYEYQWASRADGEAPWSDWGDDGNPLDSSLTAKGQEWKTRARAYDGADYSNWVESDPASIGNSPPTDPTTVSISPSAPKTTDELTGSADGATDPDGDSISYQYQWASRADGGATWSEWGDDGNPLDSSLTTKGHEWKARARGYDGSDYSDWVESDPIAIGDAPMVVAWLGTTGYLADGVDPGLGTPDSTTFNYAVRINDPDGEAPTRMVLRIYRLEDGRAWKLRVRRQLAATSGDWATGMTCTTSLTLPNGVYRYLFYVKDATGVQVVTPWRQGPRLDAAPQLWCTALPGRTDDFLHPETGTAFETRFRFSVMYTDGEGNPPRVRRIDMQRKDRRGEWKGFPGAVMTAWGGSPRGGKYYNLQRKLPVGEYRFRFSFADVDGPADASEAIGPDCTDWMDGPKVTAAAAADSIASAATAAITSLSAVPTDAGSQVAFTLSSSASVTTRVLNVAGRPVRTLCRGKEYGAGTNTLVWNACSDNGLRVPAGTYLVEIRSKGVEGSAHRAITTLRLNR